MTAPITSWTERKDLLELLIADVILTRHEAGITVQIRWFTNQIETGELPLPVRKDIATPAPVIERIRSLCGALHRSRNCRHLQPGRVENGARQRVQCR